MLKFRIIKFIFLKNYYNFELNEKEIINIFPNILILKLYFIRK